MRKLSKSENVAAGLIAVMAYARVNVGKGYNCGMPQGFIAQEAERELFQRVPFSAVQYRARQALWDTRDSLYAGRFGMAPPAKLN